MISCNKIRRFFFLLVLLTLFPFPLFIVFKLSFKTTFNSVFFPFYVILYRIRKEHYSSTYLLLYHYANDWFILIKYKLCPKWFVAETYYGRTGVWPKRLESAEWTSLVCNICNKHNVPVSIFLFDPEYIMNTARFCQFHDVWGNKWSFCSEKKEIGTMISSWILYWVQGAFYHD
jgi:hypothetical protein